MTFCKAIFTTFLLIFSFCIAHTAIADTQQATCEFTKKGDKVKSASGECSISDDDGKITIILKNGNKFKLKPRKKADQYIDKDDNEVERRIESTGSTQYKWENKNIRVNFDDPESESKSKSDIADSDSDSNSDSNSDPADSDSDRADSAPAGSNSGTRNSDHSPGAAGQEVEGLQELIGEDAGSGASELRNRGYTQNNRFSSGGSIYANWKNESSGECISVRTQDDSIESIVHSSGHDCSQ